MVLPETVKIGMISSTTTSHARNKSLLEIAEADINLFVKKIGRKTRFEFVFSCAEGQASKALHSVQLFKAMGLNLIIGPSWSSHIQACLGYANTNEMILFSGTSSSPLLSISDDNLFRLAPTDYRQVSVILKMLEMNNIRSVVIFRRGDSWADGIYNILKPLLEFEGINVIEYRYPPETSDFSNYLNEAEQWVESKITIQDQNKIAVMAISFTEISEMVIGLEGYSTLSSLEWYGTDGTALQSEVIKNNPDQILKIKLYRPLASPVNSIEFTEFNDSYIKKTKQYLDYYSANIYDICWIYALSVLISESMSTDTISSSIPLVAEHYFGLTGRCTLDQNGDRLDTNYQIWGYKKIKGQVVFSIFGSYNSTTQQIIYQEDEERNQPIFDVSVLLGERLNRIESGINIIQTQTKPPSRFDKILEVIRDNIVQSSIGFILGYIIAQIY